MILDALLGPKNKKSGSFLTKKKKKEETVCFFPPSCNGPSRIKLFLEVLYRSLTLF